MDDKRSVRQSVVTPELYFLISKFLKDSPLQETAQILIKELEDQKILPKRIDWTGEEHDQSFTELERKYSHIRPNHLLEICCRIGPILDKELIPSVAGVISLLGTGRQSLLRTKESVCRPRTLLDYYTRIHGMPLPDSLNCKPTHNSLKVLIGRESSVSIRRNLLVPTSFYSRTQLLRRTLGHLSSVYCVLFDRSGRYIITGADDFLVKLWSAIDGRLLTTFRGAGAEITDIAVNIDNTLLAAGSLDRILRVWDLQTAAPIAVLPGHTGMITSVNFCPSPRGDLKYLVTTSTDGSVAFWQYTTPRGAKTVFAPKPTQYHEKVRPGNAQMICASFSPGGIFLAAGSADPYVRVYLMQEDGPKRVLEAESHGDAVDSIQWAHRGLKFVSGSKDGTALVWTFESQQWKSLKLTMSERLPSCPEPEEGKKLKVTMVSWDFSDKWVMTAVNDFSIKIWDSKTGCLHKVLRGHRDEVYVLESHPKDEHVLLSAGHDSQLFIWDIVSGTPIAHFVNTVDDQMPGRVFDAKWSPDGSMIAATDSHGHMLMFGVGINKDRFTKLPEELFFHTDYRPLIRDSNHLVMDEQTQTMPHLMLPPFLVDVDGNPHPPEYQRFVPGRENCPSDQLVPNTAVGPDGVEVIDEHERSQIDFLIEALANRQGQNNPPPDSNNDPEGRERNNSLNRSNSISRFSNTSRQGVVVRRAADVEGVRQSSGNWQRDTTFKWGCRIYLRPMKYAQLQAIKQVVYSAGQDELDIYRRELRRRPIMITTGSNGSSQNPLNRSRNARGMRSIRNQRRGPRPAYRTRAAREREPIEEIREEEDEEEEEESASNSGDSSFSTAINEDMLSASSTSDSETSDYSDWVADKPGPNLEPPKRAKRKRVQRREISPSSDNSQPRTSEQGQGQGKKKYPPPGSDVAEAYRPPEWLSEIIPRKAPYYPQMGDEVVYFRQGHQKYLDAVRDKKVYKLTNSSAPWNSLTLRDHELVRVIGIKYEIRPPRLCCLKLALINRDGQMTGQTFTIKYHDMPDVLDFFVLRQTYDLAVARNWSPGHRFRCMIDDGWWIGQIESRLALSPEFPDSLFMCFRVRWDNGEYEYMSPWDLEPIDESRLPQEHGGAVPVLPEEIRATLYQPKTEEWPRGDRDASCRRIIAGLEKVMVLAIADPFLAPVDLNVYPEYAYIVEYPIDLTTIKARFENHFYRRITSAQFDVRYLATNAEKFNKSHSSIVRNARIITDLCLRIIRDPNDVDVGPVYHQLADTYKSSESENDNDDDDPNQPGPSSRSRSPQKKTTRGRAKRQQRPVTDWRMDCRLLLDMIWKCDDSEPFREPVDTLEHPDYLQVVDSPMDLRTVREDLFGGNYSSPLDFAKDMRLIIQNSKNFNTNKRSRIYSMTIRLSNLFETQVKEVIHNWKIARRRGGTASPKKTPNKRLSAPRKGPKPGPSNCNGNSLSRRKNASDSDDDDDDDNDDNVDDDDDDNDNCRPRGSNVRTRNNRISRRAVGNTNTNGVSSTVPASSLPSSSNRGVRKNVSQPNSQGDDDDSDSSSSDSSSTSSSDDTEEDKGIPVLDLGNGNRLRKFLKNRNGNDSEDSYKPTGQNRKTTQKRRRNMKKNKKAKKPLKRKHMSDDNDDDNRTRKRQKIPKKIQSSSNSTSESDDSLDKTNTKEEENGPKRPRGRPKKTSPSEILNANRRTRQQRDEQDDREAEEDESQNLENSHGRGRNNRRYDSDHSYHVSSRTTRRVFLESDTEQDFVRPTRSTARKANLAWGREEDSLEEEHDDEVEIPRSIKKPIAKQSRRKKSSESDYSQDDRNIATSSSRRNNSSFRQVRTNRNSRVLPDEESDDEPVLSRHEASSSRLLRPTRNLIDYRTPSVDPLPRNLREQHYSSRQNGISNSNNGNNSVQRRIPATITSSSTVTRSHANSTTNVDAMPSSSTATLRSHSFRSHVQVDHNYGEPGPSSMRNTRRMLSRHQRNADELDQLCDVDPLQIPTQLENVSSRLRIRNTVNSTTTGRPRSEGLERALRSGRNARPRYSDEVEDENNDDDVVDDDGSEVGEDEEHTDEHVDDERRLNVEQDNDVSDNDTDSEDNQPLRYMVDASTSRKRSNLDRSNILTQSRLRNRRSNSDADYVGIKYNGSARSSTRNRKRPRYNEDSDETGEDGPHGKRRTGMRSSPSPPHRNQYNNATSTSRNSHPPDDNDDTDEHEQTISISSRGRVRKITAKARGLFRD